MSWYLQAFREFANFKGRASLKAFWSFMLYHWLIIIALSVVGMQLQTGAPTFTYLAVTFLPALALTVRRLHDSDTSALALLFWLIPYLGILIVLLFMLKPGTPGTNRWGPDELGAGEPPHASA